MTRITLVLIASLLSIQLNAADPTPTQTLRAMGCELDVPASWSVDRDKSVDRGARMSAKGGGVMIVLDVTDENFGDVYAGVEDMKRETTKNDPNATVTEPRPITIDGHKWLQYVETSAVGGHVMTSLNYVYSGPEGSFVIEGTTTPDFFGPNRALLTHYMGTFRFPKKGAPRKRH